ncbi:CcdB family protein [Oceanibaculum nanhaiense]|uniref:CcdB family protein n=1 Tax=Oceanibaculum nanhaiense TaxID=1909734 RepID=UPI00396E96E5
MAQYDVHRNLSGDARVPYLLDVQSAVLSALKTRVVIPVVPLSEYPEPMSRVNPVVEISGVPHVLATTELAGAPASLLGDVVASLTDNSHDIVNAIDFLHQGY